MQSMFVTFGNEGTGTRGSMLCPHCRCPLSRHKRDRVSGRIGTNMFQLYLCSSTVNMGAFTPVRTFKNQSSFLVDDL